MNIEGAGHMFDSKAAAIEAVLAARQDGIRSIDVGCMQINLFYHPNAFADLEEAFDPAANVAYAVRFLGALHAQSGDWGPAIAAYHSATPELGVPYAQRVVAHWPDAPPLRLPAVLPGAASTPAGLAAEVDPNHTLTADFRARLVAAAWFRTRQQPRQQPHAVDPRHTLTAAFRAQLVAAAAARLRREHVVAAARIPPAPAAKTIAPPRKAVLAAQLSPAPALP